VPYLHDHALHGVGVLALQKRLVSQIGGQKDGGCDPNSFHERPPNQTEKPRGIANSTAATRSAAQAEYDRLAALDA
jgi:hypothetical protein